MSDPTIHFIFALQNFESSVLDELNKAKSEYERYKESIKGLRKSKRQPGRPRIKKEPVLLEAIIEEHDENDNPGANRKRVKKAKELAVSNSSNAQTSKTRNGKRRTSKLKKKKKKSSHSQEPSSSTEVVTTAEENEVPIIMAGSSNSPAVSSSPSKRKNLEEQTGFSSDNDERETIKKKSKMLKTDKTITEGTSKAGDTTEKEEGASSESPVDLEEPLTAAVELKEVPIEMEVVADSQESTGGAASSIKRPFPTDDQTGCSSNKEGKIRDTRSRSKMAKEDDNGPPEEIGQTNSPPKEDNGRKTRSKMLKEDKNTKEENRSAKTISNEINPAVTPEKRMTRSKMAMQKKLDEEPPVFVLSPEPETQEKTPPTVVKSNLPRPKIKKIYPDYVSASVGKDNLKIGKENANVWSKVFSSNHKMQQKDTPTPLQVRNTHNTPIKTARPPMNLMSASKFKSNIGDTERRMKEEEVLRKRQQEREAAFLKKQKIVKAKQTDIKKKNEEKMQKVAALREAQEREKHELLLKFEKEKEEKEKATRELLEQRKEEEKYKKKMVHLGKAMEAEARRLKEEAARQAKLKEMEEEEKREKEIQLKNKEEMERIQKQRLEEARMKELAMRTQELQKKKAAPVIDKDNYDINYDLENGMDDEDSDEGAMMNTDKKDIPLWATRGNRELHDRIHAFTPLESIRKYYACPSQSPDITEFFGKMTMKRVRSSSAVWHDTP